MKKKILVLLAVLLLVALTTQVAFADPNPPQVPPGIGSGHMGASVWIPGTDTSPGNANGVEDENRGMWRAHFNDRNPQGYTKGAANMDAIVTAHGG